jgi:hypothetical protein
MNKLQAKVSTLSTEDLREMAIALADNFSDEADIVLTTIMEALETRMTEAEFISFSDSL